MVEDRTLDIKEKLNKCFKHFAYPGCRCIDISDYEGIDTLTAEVRTPKGFATIPFDPKQGVKDIVKSVIDSNELKIYRQCVVVNVGPDESRLTLDGVPEDFVITGLPYRQVKITTSERSFYVDLCNVSYQKLCSLMLSQSVYPSVIYYADFKNCLKRKELLVLLITLSQN